MANKPDFSGFPNMTASMSGGNPRENLNTGGFINNFQKVMMFNPVLFNFLIKAIKPFATGDGEKRNRASDMVRGLEHYIQLDGTIRVASEVTGNGFAIANLVDVFGKPNRLTIRLSVDKKLSVDERPENIQFTEVSLCDLTTGDSINITHLDSPEIIRSLNNNWPNNASLQEYIRTSRRDGSEDVAAINRIRDLNNRVNRGYHKSYSKDWYLYYDESPVGDMLRQLTGHDLTNEQAAMFGLISGHPGLTLQSIKDDVEYFPDDMLKDVIAGILMKSGTLNGVDEDYISALEYIRDFAIRNNQSLIDLCPISHLDPDHTDWPDKNLLCSGAVMSLYIDGAEKEQVQELVSELLRNGVVYEQISDEAKAAIQSALTQPEGPPKRKSFKL